MANWSELPQEMLVTIAEHLRSPKDFVVFGAVCKSWQAAAYKEYLKRLCLQLGIPYLMLPVRDDDARELYSLIEHKIVDSVKLPDLKTKRCLESLGWLLATDIDGNMSLVDPFSGVEIQLPHQKTLTDCSPLDGYFFVQKMVLSARPSETSDFVLMTICGADALLAFWRLGDRAWNIIKKREREGILTDVVYYNGLFYAIGYPGVVWVVNIDCNNNRAEACIIARFVEPSTYPNPLVDFKNLYVLKTCECLYVITRTEHSLSTGELPDNGPRFHVYEVDASTSPGIIKEIHSLGAMAVFLGHNATTAVDASTSHGVIKPNHIYFTDDNWELYSPKEEGEGEDGLYCSEGGGRDMGVYSLDTGKVEPFYRGELLLSKVSPSTWVTPYQFT